MNGAASGITFFKQTTDFVDLPAGTYTFDIVPAGGTIDDSVFTVADFPLEADAQWSVFAAGYVAGGDAGNAFTVSAAKEDRTTITDGNVRVQVVHAAALGELDTVDVWAVDDAVPPSISLQASPSPTGTDRRAPLSTSASTSAVLQSTAATRSQTLASPTTSSRSTP